MSDQTRNENSLAVSRWEHCSQAAILLAASLVVSSWATQQVIGPLRHWDEAWYAQVVREMVEQDTWLTPYWNGTPWFHKPPLAYWLMRIATNIGGWHEGILRLPSYLCSLSVMLLTVLAVNRAGGNRWQSLFAGALLLLQPDFLRYGGQAQLDGPLTLLLSLGIFAGWRWLDQPSQAGAWLVGALWGLALLTKGAAGMLVPFVLGTTAVVERGVCRSILTPSLYMMMVAAAIVASPWHVWAWNAHGDHFLAEYGARHVTQAFANINPELAKPAAPVTYYLMHWWEKHRPFGWLWLAAYGVATVAAVRYSRRCRQDCNGARSISPSERFVGRAAVAATIIVIGLSVARAKFSWYLLPVYPWLAIVVAMLLPFARPRCQAIVTSVYLTGALGLSVHLAFACRAPEWENEIRALGPLIAAHVPRGEPIHTAQWGRGNRVVYPTAVGYYANRPVRPVHGIEALAQLVRCANCPFFLVHHQSHERDLSDSLTRIQGAESREVGRIGPIVLLALAPPPTNAGRSVAGAGHPPLAN